MRLQRTILPLGAALALAGCLSVPIYYREGAQVARIERDDLECRIAAQNRVPERMRSVYIDPVYNTRLVCGAGGVCTTVRFMVSPGRWKRYDANEGLRAEAAQQCMADKGYARIRLPVCSGERARQADRTPTRIQPAIAPDACILRLGSDRYRIVAP
ncbi:MAG: hypothetical protein K8F31_04680 [Roseovarius sp.]|nr:hypothetical protein [Roseovarius sp.]